MSKLPPARLVVGWLLVTGVGTGVWVGLSRFSGPSWLLAVLTVAALLGGALFLLVVSRWAFDRETV